MSFTFFQQFLELVGPNNRTNITAKSDIKKMGKKTKDNQAKNVLTVKKNYPHHNLKLIKTENLCSE